MLELQAVELDCLYANSKVTILGKLSQVSLISGSGSWKPLPCYSFRWARPSLACLLACRWGNASSPAYGTLSDYQFMRRHSTSTKRQEKARQQWGQSLSSVNDIISVFVKYTSGAYEYTALLSGTDLADTVCRKSILI